MPKLQIKKELSSESSFFYIANQILLSEMKIILLFH